MGHGGNIATRSAVSGCLASPVGFALSALVLIPLWWVFPFSTGDSSGFMPTIVSFIVGVGYAVMMGVLVGTGLPRRWWSAALLMGIGLSCGILLGMYMRSAMFDGCLLGTGPQPAYCHQEDPEALRPVVPTYAGAGAVLGLGLWVGGALNLGRSIPDQVQLGDRAHD